MKRLEGKVAIITGAAGGIGSATANLFINEGAKVVLVDLDGDKLQKYVGHYPAEAVVICAADVTNPADTKAYVKAALAHFGRIDVLFCNAGLAGNPAYYWEIEETDFDKMMAVNIKGVWMGMKYATPEMGKNGGGSIIVTSSVAGIRGQTRASSYVASKHAVVGLVKSAAIEGARLGVRVNAINPGPIETDMVRYLEDSVSKSDREKAQKIIQNNVPMKRYGLPEEVARLVLFLASDESSFITGGVHTIDGGVSV